jgi:uncharacterized RDD family membrane protein YckC
VFFFFVAYIVFTGDNSWVAGMAAKPSIFAQLIALFFYGLYMSIVEGIFKGRSLGKLITRTKAVNEDGSDISFETAFKRGLSRIVPFEQFSILAGRPWHDRWTKTQVVSTRKF